MSENGNITSLEEQRRALALSIQQQQHELNQLGGPPVVPNLSGSDVILNDDDQDTDANFNEMLKNIQGDSNDSEYVEDNAEILEILADVEKSIDFGPPILSHVADAYAKTVTRQVSKETSEKLKQGLKIPENCKAFQVAKMNPEIWQAMNTKGKVNDLKLQSIQHTLSSGLSALAMISNEIAQNSSVIPKDLVAKLLKLAMDSANLMGTQVQDIIKKRRTELKPFLSSEYQGICNAQIPPSELLFGSNLAEVLKTTKTTSAIIRSSTSKYRTRPYNVPQRQQSLNYYRPFQSQFRGRQNGHGRFQNPNFLNKTSTFLNRSQYHNRFQSAYNPAFKK